MHIEEAQQLARENIQRTQQKMKALYDRTAQDPEYEVGQRVWVFTPTRQKGLSPKLMSRWHGPFRIIEKLSQVHFRLRTLDNDLVTTTVHANRMKPYNDPDDRLIEPPDFKDQDQQELQLHDNDSLSETQFTQQTQQNTNYETEEVSQSNAPTSIDNSATDSLSEIYKVEKILKTRKRNGKTEHLVKWLGFSN